MKTYIIAEAGVNHNGSVDIAKKIIDAGASAGVNAVKFQTFIPERLTTFNAPMAQYQVENIGHKETQLKMLKKFVLSKDEHLELVGYCKLKGVQFCSSAFDLESIDFLKKLNLPFWKIPSGEITNLPYLRKIAQFKEPVILSTGMALLYEIEQAVDVLIKYGTQREQITLLHCNTEYPTPACDVNLRVLETLRQAFSVKVGYSDHTEGIEFPIAAVALGATVIEKHVTIDKFLGGPDHKASLNPVELKEMVKAIRNVEIGLGSQVKRVSESEKKNVKIARKSIVASSSIKKGDIFTEKNITVKRPGIGLSPMLWDSLIGKISNRDYEQDELIEN